MKKIFIVIFFPMLSRANVDQMIFIQGQIGNSFDKQKVKVIDSNDQSYYLPKSVFPKNFKFEKGKTFNIEVTEELFKGLDIKSKAAKN